MKKIRINFPEKNEAGIETVRAGIPPIGTIMWTSEESSPAEYWGGIWERFANGRVVVGVDENDGDFIASTSVLGDDGTKQYEDKEDGSKDSIIVAHNHTMSSDGSHTHNLVLANKKSSVGNDYGSTGKRVVTSDGDPNTSGRAAFMESSGSHTHTIATTGSSGTNANLQPYVTAYCWRRIG